MSLVFHVTNINNFNDVVGGVDGTPTDITHSSTTNGLLPSFNGSSSKIVFGDIGTVKSVSMLCRIKSTTESIIDLNGTANIDISSGTVRGNNWATPTIYIDGAATASLTDTSGFHHIVVTSGTGVNASAVVAGLISSSYGNIVVGDIRGYSNELSASDVIVLCDEVSVATGVSISEFSYQHDPAAVIPVQTGEVLRIGGKLVGDAVDTISDRALSNDAAIHGAMPADGFFVGGRRFDGVDDYLELGNDIILGEHMSIMCIFSATRLLYGSFIGDTGFGGNRGWLFSLVSSQLSLLSSSDGTASETRTSTNANLQMGEIVCAYVTKNADIATFYADGNALDDDATLIAPIAHQSSSNTRIGAYLNSGLFEGVIYLVCVFNRAPSVTEIKSHVNTLAVLPFWSINYRDFPDNVTEYTDRFPHSSTIIASGTFKVDDDKLTCTSAGTLTYSASHKFDGAEFLIIDKDLPTEFGGTGTATSGTKTIGVAQGSNKISVAMNTGDAISSIDVQFRAEV